MQSYTNEDMKRALSRRRAVERHELLEHVPPTAIGYMQTKGWIQRDPRGAFFYVTRKAWLDLGLPSHDPIARTAGFRMLVMSPHPSCGDARAAALRMNDHIMSAAANRFADQAMIVALAIARGCVEKIDAKLKRPVNGCD